VLLTYAEYQRLLRTPNDLAEWLEMDEDIEFEIGILRKGRADPEQARILTRWFEQNRPGTPARRADPSRGGV
jgi:hypothetical protein